MTPEQRTWVLQMPLGDLHPNRIRIILMLKGMSERELARRCGVSQTKMRRIISGETRRVEATLASDVANMLWFTIDELFADRPNAQFSIPQLQPPTLAGLGGTQRGTEPEE